MFNVEGKSILASVLDALPQPAGCLYPLYQDGVLRDFEVVALNKPGLDYLRLPPHRGRKNPEVGVPVDRTACFLVTDQAGCCYTANCYQDDEIRR